MARKNQYEIGVGIDTGGVDKSIANGLVDPLEEAADAFDSLEKAANGADLDKELGKAQKATDKLEDELDDARAALKQLGHAARDAGDDGKRGMALAEEGVQDFKQEAQQSAKETAASFSGSFDDIGGMAQEVAANAFGGFGPAGVAAGLAAAAGLGLVFAEMEAQKEQAEQLRERLSGLYQGALESGRDYIDQAQFIAEAQDLYFNPDRAEEWKQLQADAKQLGLEDAEIIKANSGDLHAQALVQARINDLKAETYGDTTNIDMLRLQSQEMGGIEERWMTINEVTRENKQANQDAAATMSKLWMEAIDGAESAEVAVDDFGNQLVKLGDGKEIVIDAKTGLASDNIAKFKTDTDQVIEQLSGKEVKLRVKVDESEWQAWQRKPRQFTAGVTVRGKELF